MAVAVDAVYLCEAIFTFFIYIYIYRFDVSSPVSSFEPRDWQKALAGAFR